MSWRVRGEGLGLGVWATLGLVWQVVLVCSSSSGTRKTAMGLGFNSSSTRVRLAQRVLAETLASELALAADCGRVVLCTLLEAC